MTQTLINNFAAGCTNVNQVCLQGLPHTTAGEPFVQQVIAIAIGITAALSVLFIVIGGLRYILSQGDSQAISKAKSTIMYALIGLAVAVIAQVIVIFVINGIT